MSLRRLYLEDLSTDTLKLEEDECHHAKNVLRAQVGQEFVLFDGQGHEKLCSVREINKRCLILESLGPPEYIDRRPRREISVAVSFPKARSRSFLIEKIVELGTRCIIPLLTSRGVEPPGTTRIWRESLSALKQCGINHIPEIRESTPVKKLINQKETLVLLDSSGEAAPPSENPLTLLIGPEGGFSEDEIEKFSGRKWKLGEQTLRTETACLAALARLSS